MWDDTNFFGNVRKVLFANNISQSQVDGIKLINQTWQDHGDGDVRKWAYVLATPYWETGRTMQPIEEYGKGRGHAYGLPTGPWHQVYDGNGDVQLTFEANYRKATQSLHAKGLFLDCDLEKNAALARRPDIAAAVLVYGMQEGWFTGKKLSDYITAASCDYINSRRIINILDRAQIIAGFGNEFLAALKL